MTETASRKKVASIMNGWVGGKQGSSIHKEILKIYNEYAKAHGMALAHESYAWCDITTSAAWIKAGMAGYVPIAMSCGQSISKAKSLGIWVENDAYKPKVGDACIYDWEDDGRGDDTTGHDHIGIVVSVGTDTFSVVEGNAGSPSQVRRIQRRVNQRYIRGFICPDYKTIAKKLTPKDEKKEEVQHKSPSLDQLVTDVINGKYGTGATRKSKLTALYKKGEIAYTYDQIQDKVNEILNAPAKTKVTYEVIAKHGLNIRKEPVTGSVIKAMPYGAKCTCDGTTKKVDGVTWMYITYKTTKGWASGEYLKKV